MVKRELVENVARKVKQPKKLAEQTIDVFLSEIARVLSKGEKVVLSGFGTFRVKRMKGKTVKVPNQTGLFKIKSHRLPRFTSSKTLKRIISR